MIFKKKKKKEIEETEYKSTGISIGDVPAIDRKYYNISSLILNGLINALILTASIITILDSFEVSYSKLIFVMLTFMLSFLFSSFYLSKWWKLFGYIIVLAGFVYGVMQYSLVLRGGFGVIANAVMEVVEVYLNLPIERRYTEFESNPYVAVTLCIIFIAGALGLILNIAITESKGFVVVFLMTFPFVQISLYLDRNINLLSITVYFIALVVLVIFRNSRYYRSETKKKKGYSSRRKKNNISYDYVTDPRNTLAITIVILGVILAITAGLRLIYPQTSYAINNRKSVWKESTKSVAKQFALVGFWGMLNPNGNGVGGMGRGELGQVDKVTMDYEDDLHIATVVIPEETTIYLRAYTGTYYENNSWKYISETNKKGKKTLDEYFEHYYGNSVNEHIADLTYDILKNDYTGNRNIVNSKKSMMVYNTFANDSFTYIPYCTEDVLKYCKDFKNDDEYIGRLEYGTAIKCDYFSIKEMDVVSLSNEALDLKKLNSDKKVYKEEEIYREYVYDTYLDVPKKNKKSIDTVLEENNITKMDGLNSVNKIIDLFEEKYEYTLMPGRTPLNQDFVNYFLTKSKKGYCTYFASSAVLMLRELGIPARYVGGYMVDTTDNDYRTVIDSMFKNDVYILEDENKEYSAYDITANDSNAHAWVEVYVDNLGWIKTEVTPGSADDVGTEEDTTALNELFNNVIFNEKTVSAIKNTTQFLMLFILGSLVFTIIMYFVISLIIRIRRRKQLDSLKNMQYLMKLCKACNIGWDNTNTYEMSVKNIYNHDLCSKEEAENILDIFEKSRFSKNGIDQNTKVEFQSMIFAISNRLCEGMPIYKKIRYFYLLK